AGLDGVIVTAKHIEAARETTVYADPSGHFVVPGLEAGTYHVHARAFGRAEGVEVLTLRAGGSASVQLALAAVTAPRAPPWQLPANRWLKLALDRFPDDDAREEFKRQCGYCHQQGSWATRGQGSPEACRKPLAPHGPLGAP